MKNKDIQNNSFYLNLIDTSREGLAVGNEELLEYLNISLGVLEPFLFSDRLGLSRDNIQQIEICLTICGTAKIKALNEEYRNKPKVTDVLSFPVHDSLRSGEIDELFINHVLDLGDVIICRDICLKQAKEFNITYEQELVHLLVHGLLHLCGYDHEVSESEEQEMFSLEEELVELIYKKLGFNNGRVS